MKIIKQIENWLVKTREIHIETMLFRWTLTFNIATILLPILILSLAIDLGFIVAKLIYE